MTVTISTHSTALIGGGKKRHIVSQVVDGGRYHAACGATENSTQTRKRRSEAHSVKAFDAYEVTCSRCRAMLDESAFEQSPTHEIAQEVMSDILAERQARRDDAIADAQALVSSGTSGVWFVATVGGELYRIEREVLGFANVEFRTYRDADNELVATSRNIGDAYKAAVKPVNLDELDAALISLVKTVATIGFNLGIWRRNAARFDLIDVASILPIPFGDDVVSRWYRSTDRPERGRSIAENRLHNSRVSKAYNRPGQLVESYDFEDSDELPAYYLVISNRLYSIFTETESDFADEQEFVVYDCETRQYLAREFASAKAARFALLVDDAVNRTHSYM